MSPLVIQIYALVFPPIDTIIVMIFNSDLNETKTNSVSRIELKLLHVFASRQDLITIRIEVYDGEKTRH